MGYIYILTNPAFPQYVRIGYAASVRSYVEELNRSTALPFPFRVYASYEADNIFSDAKVFYIMDKLNPGLRSSIDIDGKTRARDFYAMDPEDAYTLLAGIAQINGGSHRLRKWTPTPEEQRNEELARIVCELTRERQLPFAFSRFGIAIGEELCFRAPDCSADGTPVTVSDDTHVLYEDALWTLDSLAKRLLGSPDTLIASKLFYYRDESLYELCRRQTNT